MAQQLLHRLLLTISFDNPNGTATVTQTSFGNFFWQSQWHSDSYTDFFWQSFLTIPMAQHVPYSFCWLPLHLNSSWHCNDESSKNANESAKATKVLRTTAKMIHELLPNMIKVIKIWQGHKVSTKKTTSANTSAKPTKHYAQCENATWIIAGYEKKHQNTVGTQADYKGTKNANESSKATKYCAQQQKWYMN